MHRPPNDPDRNGKRDQKQEKHRGGADAGETPPLPPLSDFFAQAEPPEVFRPDVVITPEAVLITSLRFREMELRSGSLVDVSEMARDVGFPVPVAVTKNLWQDIATIPKVYATEEVDARLHDVLSMAVEALRQTNLTSHELLYNLVLHVADNKEIYSVRLICEPGDDNGLVVTLSSAEKDKNIELGEIRFTDGALDAFAEAKASPAPFLLRHQRGDWGELDQEDWAHNDRAALEGNRLLSAYTLPTTGAKLWIVTEWDRSLTTLLRPDEY